MELFGRELSLDQMVGLVECHATPDEDLVHRAALEIIAALRESQRRADAAVEDLEQFGQCGACANFYRTDGCGATAHSYCDGGFKWRGPQEAGKEVEA